MGATLCAKQCSVDRATSRALGEDDRAAVCALYPPGATPAPPAATVAAGACRVGASPAGGLSVFATVALGLLVLRRRRPAERA
jgi:MYXO-CTERM domain-containing protein